MKKLLIVFSIFLGTLTSCGLSNSYKPEVVVNDTIRQDDATRKFDKVTNFTYQGHSYIAFSSGRFEDKVLAVVHDPNCQCLRKDSVK